MNVDFEHIVIGGGISGLSLAHRAARDGFATLVLEGSERLGGCINSWSFPDCGDFWIETGGHTCFNSYGNLLETLDELDLTSQVKPKAKKLSYTIVRDGMRSSIMSTLRYGELLLSLPGLFRSKEGKRVADYYGKGLGARNYAELFGPAFRAVICQPADDFPADLLFRRKPRRKELIKSFTFEHGLSDMIRTIAAGERIEVRLGQAVESIGREGDGFSVLLRDGALKCRYLTLAIPPDQAARLLPNDYADARAAMADIEIAELDTVGLCVPSGEVADLAPLAGFIAVDEPFYSMVSRDYVPDTGYRGFTFHFRPDSLSEDERIATACRALGIKKDLLCGYVFVRNRLPALRVGHRERVAAVDSALAGTRLAITGNWFYGVSIEDCCTRSQEEYARVFGSARGE